MAKTNSIGLGVWPQYMTHVTYTQTETQLEA